MKTNLVEALLATPAAPEIRRILRLQTEKPVSYERMTDGIGVNLEVLFVRMHRVAASQTHCDVFVGLAKYENGEVAREAADVYFRCLDVTAVDWHSSFYQGNDLPNFDSSDATVEIDTRDGFRIACARIEVTNVQPCDLGESLEET
jgi:hypothetical protein